MKSRFYKLLAAALLVPAIAYAAQESIVGTRMEETERDTSYVNNATTALDRAVERVSGAVPDEDATPEPYIIRRFYSNGGSTYLFVFPGAADEPPLHRSTVPARSTEPKPFP